MPMMRLSDPRLLFGLGCLALLAAYWPGLQGGFLLDDTQNFVQLERFSRGEVTWVGPVVSNNSGPLGRPISMATFVATVAAGGHAPWAYKVGNLFLHVSIGAMLGMLALLMLRRDTRLAHRAGPIAVLVALVWLALPIHASTVLYPVQRMAQMSSLFLVGGLISYMMLRARLEHSPDRRSLWIALPATVVAFTALGAFSKENGLLLPLLCLAVEITLFARADAGRRAAFTTLSLTLFAPAAAGAVIAVLHADRLFGLYEARPFTMMERLLTQPRVLWDYVGNILVPNGAHLGLYQDDFPVSRSLWEPWTTVPALLGWLALSAAAMRWRAASPLAACGVLLFVAGHAMESSIVPLEIYFEHRNYFPAFGLLLALAGILPALRARLAVSTRSVAVLLRAAPLVWIVVLLAAAHGRALVWGSPETLMAQSESNRPASFRVQSNLVASAMQRGNLEIALKHIERAEQLAGPLERAPTALWRVIAHCEAGQPVDRSLVAGLAAAFRPKPITTGLLQSAIMLAELIEAGRCAGVDATTGHAMFARWVAELEEEPGSHPAWRLRYLTARLAAASSNWDAAKALGQRAWQDSGWNPGIGVLVVQVANSMGDDAAARVAVDRLESTAPDWDLQLRDAIAQFRAHLDARAAN